MKKGSWQPGKASWALGASGSARMPGLLDKTCWSPLVKTMTSPPSIAQAGEPPRLFRWQGLKMPANYLDEHQLSQFGEEERAIGSSPMRLVKQRPSVTT